MSIRWYHQMTHQGLLRSLLLLLAVSLNLGAGCAGQAPAGDGNVGVDPKDFPHLRVQGEPNDTFAEALDVVFHENDRAHLAGLISPRDDVDVFALGPFLAGDRIIVDVSAGGSQLDTSIAIFDEGGRLIFENDDRDYALGQLDPFLNEVFRHDSSTYFLAIANAPLATATTGTYEILIQAVRGGAPPPPVPQVVALNFAGGSITIPRDRTYTLGPFDAGEISVAYTGQTAVVQQRIAAVVRDRYEGLALDVRVLPGDTLPEGCTVSTVYFGGTNPGAFGTSQEVDAYNANRCDDSIVFTGMFTPARFGRVLTPHELGTAIGNVAAHEIGHQLGLNHVANVLDIMDTTGSPSTFLFDQQFLNSPLDGTIFPIGTQDSMLLLLLTLGTW